MMHTITRLITRGIPAIVPWIVAAVRPSPA
jgi:hypothetical protein